MMRSTVLLALVLGASALVPPTGNVPPTGYVPPTGTPPTGYVPPTGTGCPTGTICPGTPGTSGTPAATGACGTWTCGSTGAEECPPCTPGAQPVPATPATGDVCGTWTCGSTGVEECPPCPESAPLPEYESCRPEIDGAVSACRPWLITKCPTATTEDEMAECFIENRSTAPETCQVVAAKAFACEQEKESENECLAGNEQAVAFCKADIMALCPEESSQGFAATFDCMMRNSERLSPICIAESKSLVSCVQCMNAEKNAMDQCMETFVSVCSKAKEGEEEQCFMENFQEFPATCTTAVSQMDTTCMATDVAMETADREAETVALEETERTEAENRKEEEEQRTSDATLAATDYSNEEEQVEADRTKEAARRAETAAMPTGTPEEMAARIRMEQENWELEQSERTTEERTMEEDRQTEESRRETEERREAADRTTEEQMYNTEATLAAAIDASEATTRAQTEMNYEDPMFQEESKLQEEKAAGTVPPPPATPIQKLLSLVF